jgi:translation initiation factor 2 subunit 1
MKSSEMGNPEEIAYTTVSKKVKLLQRSNKLTFLKTSKSSSAEERIKIKTVKVRAVIEVRCMEPNGVRCIQQAFIGAKKAQEAKDAKIEFSVIAAPKYSVEVSADNWKRAEEVLDKVSENVVKNITKAGGIGSFKREK